MGAEMRIRIVPYEQLVDRDKNARGVFAKKWEVCVECESLEEAERLKETLAQRKQGPVIDKSAAKRIATELGWQPKREWVGLTEEEKHDCYLRIDVWSRCVEMVEAKLREKNG
jgi:hypothetical protein